MTSLLQLGAFQVLLQLKAGEGLGLAGVLLEVLSVLGLLAFPQLQGKLQLQGGGQGGQHCGVQLLQVIGQHSLHAHPHSLCVQPSHDACCVLLACIA